MLKLFGGIPWYSLVYVHSVISGLIGGYTIHQWLIGGGTCARVICAFCYMLKLFGVVVFHRSMVNCKEYICPKYMCILLYVKVIWSCGIL